MILLILVFMLMLNSANCQPVRGNWESIAPMPTARWFPGTTAVDGKIYVIAGNKDSNTAPLNVVEVYDPLTNSWETKTPMPTPRAQLSACTVDGKIYVIGGSSGPSTWTPVPNVDIYDPATDSWSKGADMPNPRTEMTLVAANEKIYAIGGIDGASAGSKSVDIYDPVSNSWTKGADMPTARGTMPGCAINGKIYVFGGTNGGASGWNHYKTLEVYDIASNSWEKKADMPESRSHLAGCVFNNKIFALGGSQVNLTKTYSNMFSYDIETDSWQSEPSMITAREAFSATVVGWKIYALGGTHMQTGLIAFSHSEVYDPTPKVFVSDFSLRLPKKKDNLLAKLVVPNSGSLKFSYHIDTTLYDGALFRVKNDSLLANQDFGLDAKKEYQFEVLAVSENNDSVNTVIKLSSYFKVSAVYSAPMGFLLQSTDKKVMLDVLSSKDPGFNFLANTPEIYECMKAGMAPFNNVDLIYTSHLHPCHFDPVLLLNAMINNPNAVSIMSVDVKKAMKTQFEANPGLEQRVFAPEIPINSFIDTIVAGIKIRLTNIGHAGSGTLSINILLDSIQILHFDDYNDLSINTYQTIGFAQLPNDVALIGSRILNNQKLIKDYYQPSDYITVSHIANMATAYDGVVALADNFITDNYQMNVPRWPMEMFDYVKKDNRISLTMVNSAPKLSRTFKDLEVVRDETVKVYVPKGSFKDSDEGDSISYSFLISNKDLPEWATFDNAKFNLLLTPPKAQTYSVTIRATDRHLSTATATFKLKVTTPVGVEKFNSNNQFLVYPNPAQSLITIENQGNSDEIYAVQLYNTMGEKIYSVSDCDKSTIEIDLSRYPISSVFLVITKDGIPECHKIVRF
jgi:N-acetylneuraminic acid mutarotase